MQKSKLVIKLAMCLFAWLFCLQPSLAADSWIYPSNKPSKSLGGGSGTINDPYLIKTAQQLANFAYLVSDGEDYEDEYVALDADIALNDITFDADNKPTNLSSLKVWKSIGKYGQLWNNDFQGTFEGRGHTISGLYLDIASGNYAGLFGAVYCGTIRDLTIKDSYMGGDENNIASGMMVGYLKNSFMYNCHVENCHINIIVQNAFDQTSIGGIVGQGSGSKKLESCSFDGTIDISHYKSWTNVAGIMALGAPYLNNCQTKGQMTITSTESYMMNHVVASGLCNEAKDITGCVNNMNFKIQAKDDKGYIHYLALNTLCKEVESISLSANLGNVNIVSTNGWEGSVGNVGKFSSMTDCAFYGKFDGNELASSTSGKIACHYLGDEWESLGTTCKRNVFLNEDNYTFISSSRRFTADKINPSYNDGKYSIWTGSKKEITTDEIFQHLNSASTTSYVWGKVKGVSTLLDGCPLPVVCGGARDADFMGEGTEKSPWLIGSESELRKLAQNVNEGSIDTKDKYFALSADIDMSNSEPFEPIGKSDTNPFCGNFDGQGHAISNIKIKDLAIFGYTSSCTIKRLAVIGAEIQNSTGEYGNCAVLLGIKCGGHNTVTDCYVGGDIRIKTDRFHAAAFIGSDGYAEISNCYFKGRFIIESATSDNKSVAGIIGWGTWATIKDCYASFSVIAPTGVDVNVYGISDESSLNSGAYINVSNCYSVCSQIKPKDDATTNNRLNGTVCKEDGEIFADYNFPDDTPWTKGAFRYILSDAKHYVATAVDGSNTEVLYDAIPMMDSSRPSNDIYHYTLKDGELDDKLLWSLPNLAIYNPDDNSEYIINCTLDPTKPFNYKQKKGLIVLPKVNMRYPLALETGKKYYTLCLPGKVYSDGLPEGAVMYVCSQLKTDADGSKYCDLVKCESVYDGVPFVVYVPDAKTGDVINLTMRSAMALSPYPYDIYGNRLALTGTFKGGTVTNVCTKFVEEDGKLYLRKVEGEQTVLPFTAYMENVENVELRDYVLLDETGNNIANVIEDNNGKQIKAILKRTLQKDKWNTICLPTNISAETIKSLFGEDTQLESLSSIQAEADGGCSLVFSSATSIEAGKSYLIKPTSNGTIYDLGSCNISKEITPSTYDVTIGGAAATIKFCGTFERKMLGEDKDCEEYFTQDNKIYHVADGQRITMNGFRCYITANQTAAQALAKARMIHSDGSTTSLHMVEASSSAHDKQCTYDLQGVEQHTETLQRGVYIKNGHKYVVK